MEVIFDKEELLEHEAHDINLETDQDGIFIACNTCDEIVAEIKP